MVNELCPYKALEKQKRFMRRKMRKPANMTTRTYVNNLLRINTDELPQLPPFSPTQSLREDELIDIVTFGIPKSWVRKMDEHDFDPVVKGLAATIVFCERMESSEDFTPDADQKISTKKTSTSKKYKSDRKNSGPRHGKWCDYHEVNTHNTSERETLKKLKASRSSGNDKPAHKNKTWKRKSDEAKTYSKKELAAIAKKASREAVKKATAECHAVAKRKSDSDDDSSTSSESDKSVNMMEAQMAEVDQQLADFDFDKVDNEVEC